MVKQIRIIDSQFNLLAEIDNYESLIYIPRWYKTGEFELRINRHKRHTGKLQKGNLFILGADIKKVCYIKHIEIGLDQNGKISEQLIIKGHTLEGILSSRLTVPPNLAYDELTANAETIMKHYVNNNVVNPADLNRKINQVEIAQDLSRGLSLFYQTRFKPLHEELEKLSLVSGLGWFMWLNTVNKKWIFDVKEGKDLTVNQSVNPPVIFSPQFDNIKSNEYVNSEFQYRNVAFVAGQGEGAARRVVAVGTSQGLDRFETFVDARDVEEVDENSNPIPVETIEARLISRGNQALSELDVETYFEAEILTHGSFIYEKDWNLGDIVTVQNKDLGLTMDARITEVKEVYQSSGFSLEATFGNSRPTLIDKIKQSFEQVAQEIRR